MQKEGSKICSEEINKYTNDNLEKFIFDLMKTENLKDSATYHLKMFINESQQKVKNIELWIELDNLNSMLNIEWNWIPGHTNLKYNELCDSMANDQIKKNN